MAFPAEALLVVLNDILDFSKIEAGRMELAHAPFSVHKCVADAVRVFGWKAREKGLALTSQVEDAVPAFLVGDADRLRQILLNLLGSDRCAHHQCQQGAKQLEWAHTFS